MKWPPLSLHHHDFKTMTLSPPKLNDQAKTSLSKLLHETVDAGLTPAIFIGVTDASETLYLDCAGDVVLGEPERGKVDIDTSAYCVKSRAACV